MLKQIAVGITSLMLSGVLFAKTIHVDYGEIVAMPHHNGVTLPNYMILDEYFGHLYHGQCTYTAHHRDWHPLIENKVFVEPTDSETVVADAGRGFTCMKYTVHVGDKSADDVFAIKLDRNGDYQTTYPFRHHLTLHL